MNLKPGMVVYRIIKMPEGRNFGKYGIHKYVIITIDNDGYISCVDELDKERTCEISEFILV